MSKVLLVDTNVSSAPIYQSLLAAGHEVWVIGGNPQDFLAKSAPHYIELDYSDATALAALIEKEAFDFVVPGCNDRSYLSCAQIAPQFALCGVDSLANTETINNKQQFRGYALAAGLAVPQVYSQDAPPADRALIVKPVDAFSGRGVTILRQHDVLSYQQALDSARAASRSGACIVEEFVEGQLYSHSCFIASGQIAAEFIVEEHGTANPFVVDTSRVVDDLCAPVLQRVRADIEYMVRDLGLVDGLMHTQFICQGEQVWIVEITRRCPGDLYSQLIELSTGFAYAACYAHPFVGQAYGQFPALGPRRWIMRHTMSLPQPSSLGSISFKRAVRIERMIPMCLAGDEIRQSPYGRIGLLFVDAASSHELEDIFSTTLARELYVINP